MRHWSSGRSRDPSTPHFDSLHESKCCAQDDRRSEDSEIPLLELCILCLLFRFRTQAYSWNGFFLGEFVVGRQIRVHDFFPLR